MNPNPVLKAIIQPIVEVIAAPGQGGADHPDLIRAINDLIRTMNALTVQVAEMDKRIGNVHDALMMPHTANPPQPHSLGNQISLILPVLNRTRGDIHVVEELIKALSYAMGEEQRKAFLQHLQPTAPSPPIQGVDADTVRAFPSAFA